MRQISFKKSVSPMSAHVEGVTAFFAAMLVCCISATPLFVHGSTNVFDDAVFWFRGGKDISGDGRMQQGEFFDDLHADDTSHANHKSSMVNYSLDAFKGNAAFQTERVVFPALGKSAEKDMQVLRLSNKAAKQGNQYYYWPEVVNPRSIFVNNNVTRDFTIVSRMKLDNDIVRTQCVFKVGYNASAKQGMTLGFSELQSSTQTKYITGRCTPSENHNDSSFKFNTIQIPTNTWFDIAVVVGNGRLRVGIALPESLSIHGNNPTIAFAETPMWTDNSLSEGDHYRLFCYNGQSAYQLQADADLTCFIGSVQQMAIWGRALSDQEVMSAFGMPRPALFRTGLDNGASNEFGGTRSGESQTIDGLGSWRDIANTMKSGDTWTVNFTALRDEANLAQIFSIKSLLGSATAQIEPILNGTSLGERYIASDARAFWPVATNLVVEGANTLVIKRKSNESGDFKLDAMELGGSLGVGSAAHGIDDGRVYPEKIATGVPSAADPNPAHWPVGIRPYENHNTNLHFRVWVDPDVVGVCTSRFSTCVRCYIRTGYTVAGSEEFTIFVNGESKTSFKANGSWKDVDIDFDPGVLRGGWNDFEIRCEAYETCYWLFDRYRFETDLSKGFSMSPPTALTVIIR